VWGKALFREAKALAALERFDEATKLLADAVQLPVSKHFAERDRVQLRSLLKVVAQSASPSGLAAAAPPPPPGSGSGAATSTLVAAASGERVLVNETRLLRLAKDNNALHLQVLLDDGASPNSCNRVGQTALHIAAIWNALDALRCLIKAGADVNAQNSLRGSTPLHAAASRGSIEAARILIEHGADPLIADESAMLPFQVRLCFDSIGSASACSPAALLAVRTSDGLTPPPPPHAATARRFATTTSCASCWGGRARRLTSSQRRSPRRSCSLSSRKMRRARARVTAPATRRSWRSASRARRRATSRRCCAAPSLSSTLGATSTR
jgi:hypothetical protein